MNIKQEFATKYAKMGWYVLPVHYIRDDGLCSCGHAECKSPGKHPMTMNGVKGATIDPVVIMSWFRDEKTNIGIAAGKSGLFVLDIDPRNGGDDSYESMITKYGRLPDTAMQFSGGGGVHYVMRAPVGKKMRHMGPGLDSLSGNKYFLAHPSKTSGVYEWEGSSDPLEGQAIADAPVWLLEDEKPAAPVIKTSGSFYGKIDDVISALKYLSADDYDLWIKVGQALHSIDAPESFDLWDGWSQTSEKYDAAGMGKKWASFTKDRGLNVESIFFWAREAGWICQPTEDNFEVNLTLPNKGHKIPPMPGNLLNPPGILKLIADQITHTARMPQPIFSVNAALSLVGTLMARKVQTETGLRTNLYIVSLGPTGCGKEHARGYIKNALHSLKCDDQLGGEDIASGQGLMSRAAISPNAIFQIDEIGDFLASATDKNAAGHKISVLTNFMKLFSSAGSVITGSEYADQKMNKRQLIEYPCINLHATGTDAVFYGALKGRHILDGYLNRFIVTQTDTPRPTKQRIKPAIKPLQPIIDWYESTVNWVSNGTGLLGVQPETPTEIKMTKEAWALFDDLESIIDEKMEDTRGTGLDSLYVRVWEHAAKISLICGVAKKAPIITAEDARWAIDFVMYWTERLVNEAKFRIADSDFGHTMNDVLKQIIKAGKEGQTEGRIFNDRKLRETPPRTRKDVLEALVGSGEVTIAEFSDPRKSRKFIAAQYA